MELVSKCIFSENFFSSGTCGQHFAAPKGQFTSPNYPGNYPQNTECRYSIQVTSGRIVLTFLDFDLGSCNRHALTQTYIDVSSLLKTVIINVATGQIWPYLLINDKYTKPP